MFFKALISLIFLTRKKKHSGGREFKMLKFGTNVDLSDERK